MGEVVPIINVAREIQRAAEELVEALARLDAAGARLSRALHGRKDVKGERAPRELDLRIAVMRVGSVRWQTRRIAREVEFVRERVGEWR